MEVYDKVWGLNLVRLKCVRSLNTYRGFDVIDGREFIVYITHWAAPDPDDGPAEKHHDHSA